MRVFVGVPLLHEYGESFIRLSFKPEFKQYLRLSTIEPHLTLKAPQEIDGEQLQNWIEAARRVIEPIPPITFHVEGSFFITPLTIALRAETTPLTQLHKTLIEVLLPFNSFSSTVYERESYMAHVTVGRATRATDPDSRKQLTKLCDEVIKPRTITARKIRLYGRRNIADGYHSVLDIELNGSY